MGRTQRKDWTLAQIVMRAFTAAFGNIKIRTRVQIFMLQGMSQPVSAGGYEETFPRGQVLQLPFWVSARGLQPGLERPHIRQDATAAALVPPHPTERTPNTIFPAHPEPPRLSRSRWARGGGGGWPHPPAQPLPTSPGSKLLVSFFFFVSHLSFRSLFR